METGTIGVQKDVVAQEIDDLADLCEFWKKNRDVDMNRCPLYKGRVPSGIRQSAIHVSRQIQFLVDNNITQ